MKTVLLIDDEPAVRRLIHITLGGDRYFRVLHAGDCDEALKVATRESVDLALLDVAMPGKDGFTVCQALRGLPLNRQPRVVMLSALSSPADRAHGRAVGADEYFTKPFSPIALLDYINQVLPPESTAVA